MWQTYKSCTTLSSAIRKLLHPYFYEFGPHLELLPDLDFIRAIQYWVFPYNLKINGICLIRSTIHVSDSPYSEILLCKGLECPLVSHWICFFFLPAESIRPYKKHSSEGGEGNSQDSALGCRTVLLKWAEMVLIPTSCSSQCLGSHLKRWNITPPCGHMDIISKLMMNKEKVTSLLTQEWQL